jgi:hypothetical protein
MTAHRHGCYGPACAFRLSVPFWLPLESGELGARLDELANGTYVHPSAGERVRFARSTIERWLYAARNEPKDPIHALER